MHVEPAVRQAFRVLNAEMPDDYLRWAALWAKLPGREVFAHPGYTALFRNVAATAVCATLECDDGVVLFPFLQRSLAAKPWVPGDLSGFSDVVSPYGYGGAFFAGDVEQLRARFWPELTEWYLAQGVIAEFVRLSLFPAQVLPYPGKRREIQLNVVRSLAPPETELWQDFDHKVRKNVRRAQSEGITIEVDTSGARAPESMAVYHETLDRRGAWRGYYVTTEFLENLHRSLTGHFAYFHALHRGKIVSTELVLHSNDAVYSYLGGTLADAFKLRPNDLLKHAVILWSKAHGKRFFVLGGGAAPNDGIFVYKKSFAPEGCVPFRAGSRIISSDVYDALINARRRFAAQSGSVWEPREGFFPAYRG